MAKYKFKATIAAALLLAACTLCLAGCGSSFEGSGSKDAASAEQLAQRTDDPWKSEIYVDPNLTYQGSGGPLNNGTYTGTGKGMEGLVTVTINVKDNRIECTKVTQEGESQSVGGYEAIRDGRYAKLINAAQSYDFGSVSGAAITTSGIRAALVDALIQAGANLDASEICNTSVHGRNGVAGSQDTK